MRARTTWLLFVLACGLVGAVMVGVTWAIVRLDASRIETEQEALREELVRLSLWRMDSVITPLLSREIAEAGLDVGDEPLPAGVRARFVVHPDGRADAVGPSDPQIEGELLAMIAVQAPAAAEADGGLIAARGLATFYRSAKGGTENSLDQSQSDRNEYEYNKRVASVQDNLYNSSLANPTFKAEPLPQRQEADKEGAVAPLAILEMMRPMWWNSGAEPQLVPELVMVRRVRTPDGERIDGSWLDWPAVRAMLQAEIADLLPNAALVPADRQGDYSRQLATLPVALDPGAILLPEHSGTRPLRLAIGAAWLCVVVAVGAVAVLMRGSLALSERRAAFVSAVTHELRTPLTTFRMYTEMLSDGMVEDDKRDRYVATLRREAERLGQLVENVLTYARIEADHTGPRGQPTEVIEIDRVLERCCDRLIERARAAGLELALDIEPAASGTGVRVDVVAIEQILFNLVDNAAKYGATEARPMIEVQVSAKGRAIEIAVRDFGPGVPESERARVFEPFAKGVAHESGTKPGVGLGLALSRRLAEQMGGRLELRAADRGANFVVSLPVA